MDTLEKIDSVYLWQLRTEVFKMSLEDFGKVLGVSNTTIYRWESGYSPMPKYLKMFLLMLEEDPQEIEKLKGANYGVKEYDSLND